GTKEGDALRTVLDARAHMLRLSKDRERSAKADVGAPRQRHAATARVRHRNTAVYNSVVALATKSPTRITSPRIVTWEIEMARGNVKWFNPTKGYGFIQPQGGGKDVFVHLSAVERAGLSTLNEGQQIEYEIEENRGKTSAVNLKVK